MFDVIGCYKGRFVAIELKRPGKYSNPREGLTASQWNVLNQIRANDGVVIVADSDEPIFLALKLIDEETNAAS